jgi:hypothetical protein
VALVAALGTSAVAAAGTFSPETAGAKPTYYACLKSGKLTQVGTAKPACAVGASVISWNATGPAGPAGVNGSNVVTSTGVPGGTCTSGDSDIELDNGEVWTCTASAWVDSGAAIVGAQGPAGPAGPAGQPGANGTTILNGSGPPPTDGLGDLGDFYLDTTADVLYGPAVCKGQPLCQTSWGTGTSLIGATGPAGNTILNGAGAPSSTLGNAGDFYLDTVADVLYGPAAHTCNPLPCHSIWGSGVSLVSSGEGPAYDLTIPTSPATGTSLYSSNAVTIASMAIPTGGDYTVNAVATLSLGYDNDTVTCTLTAANPGGNPVTLDSRSVGGSEYLTTMNLQGVVSIAAGGALTISCLSSHPNQGDTASQIHMTATQVSTFSQTVG